VLRERVAVDARAVVEALQVADTRQLQEVPITLLVLCQQKEVARVVTARPCGLAVARAGRKVRLHSDNRVDATLARRSVELNRAEHVAVIGERDRVHAELDAPVHQLVDARGSVQQREVRVVVEVDEASAGGV